MECKLLEKRLEIQVKSFKDRAFAGPGKIPQIPQLIERGKARTEVFFRFS